MDSLRPKDDVSTKAGQLQADAIRKALQNASVTAPRPILVIFDDSIPSNDDFNTTKRFVLEISKVIRDTYGLGPSPYISTVDALDKMHTADPSLFYPKQSLHSALIRHSLDEFTRLDPQGRISVIYFPMAASQLEVAPFFKELLYLDALLRVAQPTLTDHKTADLSQRAVAQEIAERTIKNSERIYVNAGPPTPVSGAPILVATDAFLIQAMTVVLRYYSEATQRPHFLSFSWTVPDLQVLPYFEPMSYGWRLAAVGNGQNGLPVNVHNARIQFAARSLGPKDFVAVANSTATAQRCATNSFEADAGAKVIGLAFPGNVTSSVCGTSFSTPRLAWLLAAREVMKGRVVPKFNVGALDVWMESNRALVLSLQNDSPEFLKRYDVHVDKLLGL